MQYLSEKICLIILCPVPFKENNKDIENSTQVMSDQLEDAKNICSFDKTEINTMKRRLDEVIERTTIRRE